MKSDSFQFLPLNPIKTVIAVLLCIVLSTCSKKSPSAGTDPSSTIITYTGDFMRTEAMDSTSATGTVLANYNTQTSEITYQIVWHSLSSIPVAMHFHDNGPVIVTLTGWPVQTDESLSGTTTFTNTQITDLKNGLIYVMIHTSRYPDGEIMAPLKKQ